eukprot:gene13653-9780_t
MEETRRLLGGEWAVIDSQSKLWTMKEKRQLLIFVSSTFTDTHLERDILMEKIFPRLQGEAMKYDVSVAISDMRYGVRDENTKDHKAWLYCKRELERCFHHSSGLFFLSLQGDKYGSRPLPRSVDRDVMNLRLDDWLTHIQEQGSTADEYLQYWQYFHRWYELDENAIPAEFVLRELHSVNDSSFWQDVVPTLRKALMDLPCDRDCPDIRVGQSVTEWETRYALHLMKRHSHSATFPSTSNETPPVVVIDEQQKNRMLWLHRHFESGIASTDDVSGLLADQHLDPDVAAKLNELLRILRDHLGHEAEVYSADSEPTERERAFSASAAAPARGLSSSVSSSLSSRGGRPLLLRCASSSEYLDVIHQRQLLKQQSVGSHGSGSQHPHQTFGRYPPLPMSRQSSIQYSESTDDIHNRSRSSTSFSLAGLAISRQVSVGGDASMDQLPPHLELPWQTSVDATAVTITTPASATTALQQYLTSWEQVTYDALHEELQRIAMESSAAHGDSSSSASAAPPPEHPRTDDDIQHQLTLNGGFDSTTRLREMLHHCHWAMEKVTTFIGREVLQQKILDQLQAFANTIAPTSGAGLNRKKPQASPGKPLKSAISLVLVGESGCGKTALMARMAQLLYTLEQEQWLASSSTYPRRPVIIRFCGTSSASTNALALMQSIIHQVTYLYDVDLASLDVSSSSSSSRNTPVGTDTVDVASSGGSLYHQTVQQFHRLLAKYPVLLLLDSLDQLSDDYEARSELSFLKGLNVVHPRTRIIVSTLPDETISTTFNRPSQTLKRYAYQCDSRLQEWHVPRIVVRPFGAFVDDDDTEDDADGAPMLLSSLAVAREVTRSISQESEPEYGLIVRHILTKQYGRTLTTAQWTYLLHQAAEEPTALYLQLACRVISSWSSFPPSNPTATSLFMELSGGVVHVIHQVLDILEYTYGQALVRMVLGYITTAQSGIRDSEMCDLLSLDDGVMHEVFQYALTHTPTMSETIDPWDGSLTGGTTSTVSVKRVPYHVWTRVRLALEGLLVEKEDGGLRWYHRQLQEVSEARFGVTFLRRHCSNHDFWRRSEDVFATGIRYWHYHAWLARYFGNIVPSDRRLHRLIASQPLLYATTHETISLNTLWHLSAQTAQGNRAKINIRRLREASHHISRAIHWQVQCLTHYLHRRSLAAASTMTWPVAHCPWFSAAEMVQLVAGIASLEYVCAIMILDKQGVALTALLHDWEMIARAWATLWDQLIGMRVWGNDAATVNNDTNDGTPPLDYQGRVCVEDMRTLFTYSYLDVALGEATTTPQPFLASRLDSRRFATNTARPDYDRQASTSTIGTITTTAPADSLAVHPQNIVKRLQDYIAWLQANMSLIVQDPSSQILYTASRYTAHASSMVHQESVFLRQIQGQALSPVSVSIRTSGGGVVGISGTALSRQTSASISPRPSLSRTLTPNLGMPLPLSTTSLSRGTSLDSGHGTVSASAAGAGAVASPMVYAPIPSKAHTTPMHGFGAPSSASSTPYSLARTPGSRRGSHATPRVASLQQQQHQHLHHHRNQAQPTQPFAHRHYQLLELLYGIRPSPVPPASSTFSPSLSSMETSKDSLVMQWLPLAPRWHTRPPTLFGHRNGVRHVYPVPSLRLGHVGPSPSTSLVSHCWQEIKLWDLRANMCTRTLHPTRVNSTTKQEISCLTLTPSGDHVVVCMTPANTASCSIAQIWHLWTGHCLSVRRIELPTGAHAVVSSTTPLSRSGNHVTVPDHREVIACICANDFEQATNPPPSCWSPGSNSGMESSEDDDQDGYGAYVLFTAAKDRSICVWWVPAGEVSQPWVLLQVITMAHRQDITRLMIWRLSLSTRLLEILGRDHRPSLSPKSKQLSSLATVLASVPVQTMCLATLVGHKAPVSALAYYRFDRTGHDTAERVDGREQSEVVEEDDDEEDAHSAIGSEDGHHDDSDDDEAEMGQIPTVDSDSDEGETDIGGEMGRRLGSRSMDDFGASVDGSWLASAAGNLIKIWPLDEDFLRHRRRLSSAAGSSNSHRRDKKATSLPCLATLTGHQSTIAALQVLPAPTSSTFDVSPLLLSAGREDCSIRLWQLVSRRFTCVYSWSPHRVALTDLVLTLSPSSGRGGSGSGSSSSRLHDSLRNTDPFHDEDEVEGMNTDVETAIRLVSCSVDKTLRVWDTRPLLTSVSSSSSSSSSSTLSSGLWTPAPSSSTSTTAANATRTSSLPTPPPPSSTMSVSASSVPLSTAGAATTESDDEHRGTVTCVTVSINGHFLLSAASFTTPTGATGHVIRLWDTHSQQVLHSYEEPHVGEEAPLDRDRDDIHGGVHVSLLRFVEYIDTAALVPQRAAVDSIDTSSAQQRTRSESRETATIIEPATTVSTTCPQYFVSMTKHNRGRFKLWSTSRRRDFQCLVVVTACDTSNPLVDVLLLQRDVCVTVASNGHVKAWSIELLRKVARDGKSNQRTTVTVNDARGASGGSGKSSRSTGSGGGGGGGGGGNDTNGPSKGSRKGGSSSTSTSQISKRKGGQSQQLQQSQRSRGGGRYDEDRREEPSEGHDGA